MKHCFSTTRDHDATGLQQATGSRPVKALCMFSGGLDSLLAVCIMRKMGIIVNAVTYESPFFESYRARQMAESLSIPLQVEDFGPELMTIVRRPNHGYGSQANPCIDCHIAMLRRTGELMNSMGFDFLFTGEVINQRPMSQNAGALKLIARLSEYEQWIVRPLSAALLEPTEPERRGWIVRERMGSIEGRSRREQLRLAAYFGIKDIPAIAGGCRLTEPNFARRLIDLKDHEGLRGMRAVQLLKIGRHLRLGQSTKLIVGRNERDNMELEGGAELYDLLLKPEGVPGPTGLVPITIRDHELQMAASICARYSDAPPDRTVRIRVRSTQGVRFVETVAADPESIKPLLI